MRAADDARATRTCRRVRREMSKSGTAKPPPGANRAPTGGSAAATAASVGVQARPRPLAEMPGDVRSGVRVVLTDLDDTLTSAGKLTASAYAALERLHTSGRIVVPVTGRPAGWCDHIARMWPVDAVVGENGAFYFRYDAARRLLVKRFLNDDATRAANRARLGAIAARTLAAVPGSALASDQLYRETDLAID